ncbi:MAG: hydantoinase B/oxoprolinase family protein, partial [Acidobacteriota bacterium]
MSHNPKNPTDPITTEVIRRAFQGIAEEMGVTLIRTAYSTNIKERRDCSCAVFSPKGELISLAEHIPIHLGSMLGLMKKITRENDPNSFHSGDVIIANDPYLGGGSHLPDITLIRPVLVEGRLSAFAANIAHWSDVGGSFPGAGTAGASTEIYQEGFRLPPTWIQVKGRLQEELLDFILSNMRGRDERAGDFRAQLASLNQGEKRLQELFNRFGKPTISKCLASILDYSERRLRQKIREIPEGEYSFQDYMDDDGISKQKLLIKVLVKISHGKAPLITFDFDGTSPQAEGGINMVRPALEASVYYAVKALTAPNVPMNAGFQRPVQIIAPEGCLVNAREPAAVGGRTDTCQRVVDVILGALSRAVPEKIMAASNGATTALVFGGSKKLSGRNFVYVEALGGGMGA